MERLVIKLAWKDGHFFTSPEVTKESGTIWQTFGTEATISYKSIVLQQLIHCRKTVMSLCFRHNPLKAKRILKKSSSFYTILPKASYFVALDLCSAFLGVVLDQ